MWVWGAQGDHLRFAMGPRFGGHCFPSGTANRGAVGRVVKAELEGGLWSFTVQVLDHDDLKEPNGG